MCGGITYPGRHGEVLIDPHLYKPCCQKKQEREEEENEEEEDDDGQGSGDKAVIPQLPDSPPSPPVEKEWEGELGAGEW